MPVTTPSELGLLFGARLREVRIARKLTQIDLAERTRLPHTHISAMERGVKLPTLHTLLRLAVALECKAAKLVGVFDGVEDLESMLDR